MIILIMFNYSIMLCHINLSYIICGLAEHRDARRIRHALGRAGRPPQRTRAGCITASRDMPNLPTNIVPTNIA